MNKDILNSILAHYKQDENYNEPWNLLENVYFQAIDTLLHNCYQWAEKQKDFESLSDEQKEYIFFEALYDFWRKEIHQMIDNENYIKNLK